MYTALTENILRTGLKKCCVCWWMK